MQKVFDDLLFDAAGRGDIQGIDDALSKGANINFKHIGSYPPVYAALLNGQIEAAEYLIVRGADVNLLDRYGRTLLDTAAGSGFNEGIEFLIQRGVDVNAVDITKHTPLHTAAANGHAETVARLIRHKATVNALNDAGESPLHEAAEHGRTECVGLLLSSGADMKARTTGGFTASQLAHKSEQPQTEHLLKAYPRLADKHPNTVLMAVIAAKLGLKVPNITTFVQGELQNRSLQQGDGMDAYAKPEEIRDMVSEYATCVMLPHLLADAGIASDKEALVSIKQEAANQLSRELVPLAAQSMLGGKNLKQILEATDRWHIGNNSIPSDKRPLLGGRWHKLIEDFEVPGSGSPPIIITALDSRQALVQESRRLHHCVGKSTQYGDACLAGRRHILSIRQGDKSLATLEVTYTGDLQEPIRVEQFRGENNRRPPREALHAFEIFKQHLFKQHADGKIVFNPIQGKIHETDSQPAIIQLIGFEPSRQAADACLAHYIEPIHRKSVTLAKDHRHRFGSFIRDDAKRRSQTILVRTTAADQSSGD